MTTAQILQRKKKLSDTFTGIFAASVKDLQRDALHGALGNVWKDKLKQQAVEQSHLKIPSFDCGLCKEK